jgi:hypothetical protein
LISVVNDNPRYYYRDIKREHPDFYSWVVENNPSFSEGLFKHLNPDSGNCSQCGSPSKFVTFRDGFQPFCSHKCYSLNDGPKQKREATTLARYGVTNSHQSPEVRLKFEQTMLETYGVKSALQSDVLMAKAKATLHANHGVDNPSHSHALQQKKTATNFEKFGYDVPAKNPEVKAKIKATNLSRYGVDTPLRLPSVIEMSVDQRRSTFMDNLAERSKAVGIRPEFDIYSMVGDHHEWSCLECEDKFSNHMDDGKLPRCPRCYGNASRGEAELRDFIQSLGQQVQFSVRHVIPPKELDIYLPDHKLAIEYNGLYWHSDEKVHRNYHLDKTTECLEKGIRLIHVFENEWLFHQDKVKSRLTTILGKFDRVFARKCEIRSISFADHSRFMKDNHIQGSCPFKVAFGMYYNDVLVSMMSFGKARYGGAEWELLRYANTLNTRVLGGGSRLFSHFVKIYSPTSVVSYSDRRWNTGGLYNAIGFRWSHASSPNFFYSKDGLKLESRIKYQKHRLVNLLDNFDPKLSGEKNMKNHGYLRIFDCGNDVFRWEP